MITECSEPAIWPQVLASPSTLQTNVLTPSCFFAFYPDLTDNHACLVRELTPAPPEEVWRSVDSAIGMGYDVVVHNGNDRVPCKACPTFLRRTRGARDMTSIVWRRSRTTRFDEYVETVDTQFQLPHANIIWQWSRVCFNPVCPHFTTCVFHHPVSIFRAAMKTYRSSAVSTADDDCPYDTGGHGDRSFNHCKSRGDWTHNGS